MKNPVAFGAILIADMFLEILKLIRHIGYKSYLMVKGRTSSLTPFKEELPIPSKKVAEEPDLPDFQEIFELGNDLILGVEYLEYSPDEKAVIRIVGSSTFSKRYYRKVNKDQMGKFITVDGNKFYLQKARVQSY